MVAESSLTLLDLGQPSQPSTNLPDMNLVIESDVGNMGSITVSGSDMLGCLDMSEPDLLLSNV
jgi:hypothetical protein